MAKRVLVIDDRQMMRDSVERSLQRAGYNVITADGAENGIDQLPVFRPDIVLTDLRMAGGDGLYVSEQVRQLLPSARVILMTAHATIDAAVAAMKLGAVDFIQKPFTAAQLVEAIEAATDGAGHNAEHDAAPLKAIRRSAVRTPSREIPSLVGETPAMLDLRRQLEGIAQSDGCVLIEGEPGSGKSLAARVIHRLSRHRVLPITNLSCGNIKDLSAVEEASGLVVLDEVSELSSDLQGALLRLLRVGSDAPTRRRIIVTSTREIAGCVSEGAFRQDLFYRLNVLPVHMPPLRDKLADVPDLIEHFLRPSDQPQNAPVGDASVAGDIFSAEALDLMLHHDWPGNVRELENLCERARVLAAGRPLGAGAIRKWLNPPLNTAQPFLDTDNRLTGARALAPRTSIADDGPQAPVEVQKLEDVERQEIIRALGVFNGNRQRTAAALGIGVRTLGLKLKKWKRNNLVAQSL